MFAVSWLDMRRLPVTVDTRGIDARGLEIDAANVAAAMARDRAAGQASGAISTASARSVVPFGLVTLMRSWALLSGLAAAEHRPAFEQRQVHEAARLVARRRRQHLADAGAVNPHQRTGRPRAERQAAPLADALGMHLDMFQRLDVGPASVSIVSYGAIRPRCSWS